VSGSPFPPIAEYGFLSDCEVSALVAASGNVEWMCLPRMDSPSIFAAILDRAAGRFRLGPADATEGVSMAAQKICRTLGIGRFPQAWSYLGSDD
jgi:GH15 family glucan-1,4-alpha-glucosidase